MATVYIGLGTNMGDRSVNLARARAELAKVVQPSGASSIYETEPVGFADQPAFWNMVVRADTRLGPALLLDQLLEIEQRLGRVRTVRNAPRIIDLDILLYDDVVLDLPGVEIPHPRMTDRGFVLVPLVELDARLRHPVTGERFADLLERGQFERVKRVEP